MVLQVTSVKTDFTDLTISVSNNILSSFNADYDGDVLNIIALLTNEQKLYFENLKPASLVISSNNGKFCKDFALAKDARYGLELLNSND